MGDCGHIVIRAVLLDAYGTLIGLAPPAPALRRELLARCGVEVSLQRAEAAMRAEIVHYRARMHDASDARKVAALRRECAEVLRDALHEPALDAVSAEAMTEILLAALRFRPYPEVSGVLARLGRAGLRRVVASNWDAMLPDALSHAGLLTELDGVVTSAGVGAAKPDPALFAAALREARVDAHEAVHVGDSIREDLEGARSAGVRGILLLRAGEGVSAPAGAETITTLDELPDRLALPSAR